MESFIEYKDELEEAFPRKNPFSYYDIQELLNNRNKNASDPIAWDNENKFIRNQTSFVAKLRHTTVGNDGIIYDKNTKYNI